MAGHYLHHGLLLSLLHGLRLLQGALRCAGRVQADCRGCPGNILLVFGGACRCVGADGGHGSGPCNQTRLLLVLRLAVHEVVQQLLHVLHGGCAGRDVLNLRCGRKRRRRQ